MGSVLSLQRTGFFFGEDPTADGKSSLAAARKGGAKLKNENEMPDQRWSGV
jgi:hypothetical protein